MLHLDQLTAFDRVAREGSFSRAAVSLGLGQPAVSARILALEESVGGALFLRGRRIRLTALGESFLPFARRALEVVREGMEVSRLAQVGERGALRIGALGSLAGEVIGPALARFLRQHPSVEVTVKSGHHEFLLELLADGIVDAALTVWPAGGTGLELQPIFKLRERVVLAAAPSHPLARRKEVQQSDVAKLAQPLLRLRWWRTHHPRITSLADESRTSIDVSMEAARRLVLEGTGAGFFPEKLIAEDLARGALREVRVRGLELVRESALVRRRNAPMSPALASFIDVLRRASR
jgi:DNA-binding transcriptional LysR family regulator